MTQVSNEFLAIIREVFGSTDAFIQLFALDVALYEFSEIDETIIFGLFLILGEKLRSKFPELFEKEKLNLTTLRELLISRVEEVKI